MNEDHDDRRDGNRSTTEPATTYDVAEGERPSEAVVRAVASLTDEPVLGLEPLYETVDPDSLDRIVEDGPTGGDRTRISFEWNECTVTVTTDEVEVREIAEESG